MQANLLSDKTCTYIRVSLDPVVAFSHSFNSTLFLQSTLHSIIRALPSLAWAGGFELSRVSPGGCPFQDVVLSWPGSEIINTNFALPIASPGRCPFCWVADSVCPPATPWVGFFGRCPRLAPPQHHLGLQKTSGLTGTMVTCS